MANMKKRRDDTLRTDKKSFLQSFIDNRVTSAINKQFQILLNLKYRELMANQNELPKFSDVGFNIFSSTYEDGI